MSDVAAALEAYNATARIRYRLREATEAEARAAYAAYVDGDALVDEETTVRIAPEDVGPTAIARYIAERTPRYLVGTYIDGHLMLWGGDRWGEAEREGSHVLIENPSGGIDNLDDALARFRDLADQNRRQWAAWAVAEENDPRPRETGQVEPHEYVPQARAAALSFVTRVSARALSEWHRLYRAAFKDSRRGPRRRG